MSGEGGGKEALENVNTSVEVLKTIMSIAGESPELKDAGTNIAKTAKTVTGLINNCLLPIAAVNFAFEKGRVYFEEKFSNDISQATKDIPEDNLIEPPASIAAPVLEGLGFSHEEPNLKELYLSLLASAMDGRTPNLAHPSFAEIIRQLSSMEAGLLVELLKARQLHFPVANLDQIFPDNRGELPRYQHLFNLRNVPDHSAAEMPDFPSMLENWQRLGLIRIDYSKHITDETEYSWVESRPEYSALLKELGTEQLKIQKGIIVKTAFGSKFAQAVV